MKKNHFILILGLGLLYGCIINPIYFESDLIEVPEIVGTWKNISPSDPDDEPREPMVVTKLQGKEYLFNLKGGGHELYSAKFLKLNKILYADIVLQYEEYQQETEKSAEQPHYVHKMEIKGDTLFATNLNLGYVLTQVEAGKFNLKHRIEVDRSSDYNTGDLLIITASTKELQNFLVKNQADTNLFPIKDKWVFIRVK